jgi:hypothetical protein
MFPEVPYFKRKGKSGEYEVASILCNISNIMMPDFDVGLDFYCELFNEKLTSGIFFWVQIKATEKFDEFWSDYIKKETINTWLNQLSPVFIVLVEKVSGNIYWLSVEEKREEWNNKMADSNESINVVVDRKNLLERNGKNKLFMDRVNSDTILTHALHGIPHMIGNGYVRAIPILGLSDVSQTNIRGKVRLGLDYLINNAVLHEDYFQAYRLGKLLCEFDRGHYDHFLIMARTCRQVGCVAEARDYYNIAIGICKDDHNWNNRIKPGDQKIEDIIANIEKELVSLK